MSRSHPRPAPHLRLTKVYRRPDMSIDDIRFKLLERDRLAAADTRTEAQRWLGDPPLWRSALAQRNHGADIQSTKQMSANRTPTLKSNATSTLSCLWQTRRWQ
jgi:hypothetical protein